MKRLSVVLALLVAVAALGAAQTPAAVGELVERGIAGNLDLARSRAAVEAAREALPWASQLAKAKATVSGGYDVASGESGTANGSARLDVPIIPQVSVGASVASSGSLSGSLSVSPFTAGVTRYQETATYESAVADLAYQTASLTYQIESAAYGVVQAAASLEIAQTKYTLNETSVGIAEQAYELDGISWDDLEQTRTDLADSRQSLFDTQRAYLAARVKLYQLVGPSGGEPVVGTVTTEELLAAIAARDAEVTAVRGKPAVSLALSKARSTLTSLQAKLRATPTYRPNLSLSASISYGPRQGSPDPVLQASGTASFSFSPGDIQTDARLEIQDSILTTEAEIELETLALAFQADVADQALAVARASLDGRTTSLRQAKLTLQEAQLLLELGERTEIEVAQSALAVRSAETALLQAAASVLSAQADVLLLRVL